MLVHELYHNCFANVGLAIAAIATDTDTDGEIIDTAGYEALTFLFQSATITDGTYTVSLFHGDDSGLSDAVAVDADEVLGSVQFVAADDDAAKRIGYIGKKRYVRARVTSTGTTTGGTLGAVALLSNPLHAPVDNQ